jgi:hypothetical protein
MVYLAKTYYGSAKKTNGRDSKFENAYAQELELRKKAGDIKGFEEQKTLELVVNDFVVCTYKIDFVVYHNDGTTEYTETKGYPTDVWKLKWKLFEALYSELPDTKLTVIYQGKNWRPRMPKKKWQNCITRS